MKEVAVSAIKAERLQTRASTDSNYIDDIAERMTAGDIFPPIVIFSDGKDSWLADGIHRLDGATKAKKKIGVDERKGTREQAVEYACGANAAHGMRRTNADKKRSVTLALKTFPDRSSRSLAELCGVAHTFVEDLRQVASDSTCRPGQPKQPAKTRVGKDGKRQPASKPATHETNGHATPDIRDSLKFGVPVSLHEVFAVVEQIEEMMQDISNLKGRWTLLHKKHGAKGVDDQEFTRSLDQAREELRAGKPYTECPKCRRTIAKKCPACYGNGWIREDTYNDSCSDADKKWLKNR